MILFLDFDGVLHYFNVVAELDADRTRYPFLRGPGQLFEWAPRLGEMLVPYPDVRIVLSTSWCPVFGLDYCRARLPSSLSTRVIGETSDGADTPADDRMLLSQCEQIRAYVRREGVKDWIALDDDREGLFDNDPDRDRFVICNPVLGLSEQRVLDELETLLANGPGMPKRLSLAEMLAEMPDAGTDDDFKRMEEIDCGPDVGLEKWPEDQ